MDLSAHRRVKRINNVALLELFLSLILFTACQNQDFTSGFAEKTTVTIIATNDIHSQIDNFPRLATLIQAKEREGDAVIVVNGGDIFTGNAYVDYAEERGEPIIELMNAVGYDLNCFGNHAFDYGQAVLKARIDDADFPMVCANIEASASAIGEVAPYHTEMIGNLAISFLGLLQIEEERCQPSANPEHLTALSFEPFETVAPEYLFLDDRSHAFIALTHLGVEDDYRLADMMPELDLIIGGHSHTYIADERYRNGVLVTQSGSHMNCAGVITLSFERDKLVGRSYELVDLEDVAEEDAEIKAMVEDIYENDSFDEVVGQARADIEGKEFVASFMTDAMAYSVDADFAFYNSGGVRVPFIAAGDISKLDILSIEPFGNDVQVVTMTLKEIKAFILRNYERTGVIDYYISAGKYEIVDDTKTIQIYNKKGELLVDEDAAYRVALTNYVISYDKELEDSQPTGKLVYEVMVNYLTRFSPIYYDKQRSFLIQ